MSIAYQVANELSSDLAEKYIASNISDAMITGGKEKAKEIRELSDSNLNQMDSRVQDYRREKRAMLSAIYSLFEGYDGYKIVKMQKI